MLDSIEKRNVADQIISNTNHQHCFLFIGKNAKEEDITENICKLKWSAVIHESDNFNYAAKFEVNGKNVSPSILGKSRPLPNKKTIPFIYFSDTESFAAYLPLYTLLQNYLKDLRHLYVIGSDLNDSLKQIFKADDFRNRVSFFGIDDTLSGLTDKGYNIYSESLDDILGDSLADYDTDDEDQESDVLFYSNGKQRYIAETDLIGTHGIVTLLNRGLLEKDLPVGKTDRARAFEKFLESSTSEGPQWYAYSSSVNFIVERGYKKALMSVTEAALNNLMPNGRKYNNNPIVLMGESASSKSIMLGSIAVDVFNSHKYPVLFIDSTNLSLSLDNSNEIFEKINLLMERIEQCDSDVKILLIWDCSAMQVNNFQLSQKEAQKLNSHLINRGRRFVLLYSSYEYDISQNSKKFSFSLSDNSFFANKNGAELYFDNEEWIVPSSRQLSDNEIAGIRRIFKEYGNVDPDEKFWDTLKQNNDDLFSYFYRLTILLHESFEEHFVYEQNFFFKYHDEELKKIFDKHKNSTRLSIDEGLLELLGIAAEKSTDSEEIVEKLADFQKCIAIFSQFVIHTPRSLALSFIDDKLGELAYSSESSEIYMFAENDIPWIRSVECNGTFYFVFRSSDEAKIYLEKDVRGFTIQEQISAAYLGFIIQILDQYMKLSASYGEGDEESAFRIIELLRKIGPNAKNKTNNWNYICDNLDRITDKLKEIIDEGFDIYHSFELTYIIFIREYCSRKLNILKDDSSQWAMEQKEVHLDQLKEALKRCNKAIDDIKKDRIVGRYGYDKKSKHICNQIINEKVHCNILISEYYDLLGIKNSAGFLSDFFTMFNEIEQIIYSDPQNGFFYNTIFKLFERWCKFRHSDEEKLRYAGRLANIIDQINSNDINHRDGSGADELSGHISKFQTDLAGFKNINIEAFENCSDPDFNRILEKATPHDRASYIWLVCYNELNTDDMNKELNKLQKTEYDIIPDIICGRCREIFEFIKKYYDDVKTNGSALQLMLRIFWIWKTKTELRLKGELNECRLTNFTDEEWKIINTICRDYCNLTTNNASPFMKYMNILSMESTQKFDSPEDLQAIKTTLRQIDEDSFMSLRRMYIPFVLCDQNGEPRRFKGMVTEMNGKNGKITLSVPNCKDLHFNEYNLRSKKYPHPVTNRIRDDLVIGIGYTRPQIYSFECIMEKENRRKENKNG